MGAKKFVTQHRDGKKFDRWRLEELQDGIRLHGSFNLQYGKTETVQHIVNSIQLDNPNVPYPIPNKQLNSIFAAFPNFDVARGANDTFTWFAVFKPDLTYGTTSEQFGTAVSIYSFPTLIFASVEVNGVYKARLVLLYMLPTL
jgi:hypothetical protein